MATDEQRVTELCDELLAKLDPKTTSAPEFLGAQYDFGLAWVHFAEGFGGTGPQGSTSRLGTSVRLIASSSVAFPTITEEIPVWFGTPNDRWRRGRGKRHASG